MEAKAKKVISLYYIIMPVFNRQGAYAYIAMTLGFAVAGAIILISVFIQMSDFEVYQLKIGEEGGEQKIYEIRYNIEGSKVQSITAHPESFSIVVDIEEAPEQGSLKMRIDRDDMVELLGNEGRQVSAFVDEKAVTTAIGKPSAGGMPLLNSDAVTVLIDFGRGSEVIELIGASAISEN